MQSDIVKRPPAEVVDRSKSAKPLNSVPTPAPPTVSETIKSPDVIAEASKTKDSKQPQSTTPKLGPQLQNQNSLPQSKNSGPMLAITLAIIVCLALIGGLVYMQMAKA